jgi:hypothetical protein
VCFRINPDNRPLAGFNVLLLEDNLIVALEAEGLLRSLGAASIVAVSTVAAAVGIRCLPS